MSYIKFKIPEKLNTQIKNVLLGIAEVKDSKIRKGMNEVTKSIERGLAKLVIMAEDVSPPEIVFHIPLLCDEKDVPYAYLPTKKILGNAVKINVGSSAIAIESLGSAREKNLETLIKQIREIRK